MAIQVLQTSLMFLMLSVLLILFYKDPAALPNWAVNSIVAVAVLSFVSAFLSGIAAIWVGT
jgi:hypothetical protein